VRAVMGRHLREPESGASAGPLTAVSQTAQTARDPGVRAGRPADPDLRKRTPDHWPDACRFSGGQGVAGSNPAVPTGSKNFSNIYLVS
jgi:hypothetical protein